jgi:hypothetical protein
MTSSYPYSKMTKSIKSVLDDTLWTSELEIFGTTFRNSFELKENEIYKDLENDIDFNNDKSLSESDVLRYYKCRRWMQFKQYKAKQASQTSKQNLSNSMNSILDDDLEGLDILDFMKNEYFCYKTERFLEMYGLHLVLDVDHSRHQMYEEDLPKTTKELFPKNDVEFKSFEGYNQKRFTLSVFSGNVCIDNFNIDGKSYLSPFRVQKAYCKIEMFDEYRRGDNNWYGIIPLGSASDRSYKSTYAKDPRKAIMAALRMMFINLNETIMYEIKLIEKSNKDSKFKNAFGEGHSYFDRELCRQTFKVQKQRYSVRLTGFEEDGLINGKAVIQITDQSEDGVKNFLAEVKELAKKYNKESN